MDIKHHVWVALGVRVNASNRPRGAREAWRSFHRWVKPRVAAVGILASGAVVFSVLRSRDPTPAGWSDVALVTACVLVLVALFTILRLNDVLKPEQDRPTRVQMVRALRTAVLVTLGLSVAISATVGIIVLAMNMVE